jgi:hypothetical protein
VEDALRQLALHWLGGHYYEAMDWWTWLASSAPTVPHRGTVAWAAVLSLVATAKSRRPGILRNLLTLVGTFTACLLAGVGTEHLLDTLADRFPALQRMRGS